MGSKTRIALVIFVIFMTGGIWFVFNRIDTNPDITSYNDCVKAKGSRLQAGLPPVCILSDGRHIVSTTGIIRTSGLGPEEEQVNHLPHVTYQLTDFNQPVQATNGMHIEGYFLINADDVLTDMIGKCVQISGSFPRVWQDPNLYQRKVLEVIGVEPLSLSSCQPYPELPVDLVNNPVTLRGTLIRAIRPAPDIGYDYRLQLDSPYRDDLNSQGEPQITVIDVVPTSTAQWNMLENSINDQVVITGSITWGYAESRYLEISQVQNAVR